LPIYATYASPPLRPSVLRHIARIDRTPDLPAPFGQRPRVHPAVRPRRHGDGPARRLVRPAAIALDLWLAGPIGEQARHHAGAARSEEHTSELQSRGQLVC